MIEDDRLIGEGAGEREHIAQLRFEQPGIESQPELAQMLEAFAEPGVEIEPGLRVERRTEHVCIGIPGCGMANALEPRAGGHQRLEHRPRRITAAEVSVPDDRFAEPRRAIEPAGTLRGDAVDEFDFAHALQLIRCAPVVKRTAFHEDRANHVVAAADLGLNFVEGVIGRERDAGDERVAWLGEGRHQRAQVPQVVMRVDDRQVGFEDRFGHVGSLHILAAAYDRLGV